MKSEIAWLMEAFLEEDHKRLRVMIKDRMAEVTESLTNLPQMARVKAERIPNEADPFREPGLINQSPSMQRIMQSNPDLIPKVAPPVTQAAAQALAARQALIQGATKEKPEPGRSGPKKGLNI